MALRKQSSLKSIHEDKVRLLAEQNQARAYLGLPLLKIKIRKCVSCGSLFESIEERTCGCSEEQRNQLASYMGVEALVGY